MFASAKISTADESITVDLSIKGAMARTIATQPATYKKADSCQLHTLCV